MKGHIRERSPGHWAIVIDVRDPPTGKRKRSWYSFAGTKRQAQVECARLISEMQGGTRVDPSRMTVAAFLERWIEHMRGQVSPRSHERYARACREEPRAAIGRALLTQSTAGAHRAGLRQGAHQRPEGRAGRTVAANGPSPAPRVAASATAGGATGRC